MDVENDVLVGLVTKRAGTNEERDRLGREADLLRVVAHPGVVQLVGVEGRDPLDGLLLRRVAGRDMSSLGPQPLQVVAGLGAAIATTLADLHDLGVYHGAIAASHVLLDDEGRPVLCSFGRAARGVPPGRAQTLRREDTRALARLLLMYLSVPVPPGVVRTLQRAAGPGRPRRCGDARWLARRLLQGVPAARLPAKASPVMSEQAGPAAPIADQPTPQSTARAHRHTTAAHRWRRPVAAVMMATGLGGTGIAMLAFHWSMSPSSAVPSPPCPTVDLGCAPVPTPAGVLAAPGGRYLVGQMGDVVVVGRWRCGLTALPAVLRPQTGQLWTFATWPQAGRPVVGRLAASHVAGAVSMRVQVRSAGCDRIEVDRRGRPPLIVAVASP
jgi:hypothetical protein